MRLDIIVIVDPSTEGALLGSGRGLPVVGQYSKLAGLLALLQLPIRATASSVTLFARVVAFRWKESSVTEASLTSVIQLGEANDRKWPGAAKQVVSSHPLGGLHFLRASRHVRNSARTQKFCCCDLLGS